MWPLQLVDSVRFSTLCLFCYHILLNLSIKPECRTHSNMYNQVCVSFIPSDKLLMLMWGDIHVPLQLVDSVRFSTIFFSCYHVLLN